MKKGFFLFSSIVLIMLTGCPLPAPEDTSILTTTFNNPTFNTSNATWSKDICNGKEWLRNDTPRYEWTQVLDNKAEFDTNIVGVTGTAVNPCLSGNDVPFTHPFGMDWEFFIAPDSKYEALLAPSNTSLNGEYSEAIQHARNGLNLPVPKGVLGVEVDSGLVPDNFRARDGDRVAVFGRWIVDCGHDDFHTEIHPPLLLVCARPIRQNIGDVDKPVSGPLDTTFSTVVARPYLVSQEFGDGALREHLIKEVEKAQASPLPLIPIPLTTRIEAHPQIMPKPFDGTQIIAYIVRPPSPRNTPSDKLFVTYNFVVRSGVVVQLLNERLDAIRIIIIMDDTKYKTAALPNKKDWNIAVNFPANPRAKDDLSRYNDRADSIYKASIIADAILNPVAAVILKRGILTDTYDFPEAVSKYDRVITRINVDDIKGTTSYSVDNDQPFPIYGWLRLEWERH